jgi:RHS repeat-associated protein
MAPFISSDSIEQYFLYNFIINTLRKKGLANKFYSKKINTFPAGESFFEISYHLGNVLATVTDRRLLANGVLEADVVTATDYYPFGMTMPGRNFSSQSSEYRYGFNGKEKENSTAEGSYDFGARIYDVRIGRWFADDPKFALNPGWSPYSYCYNSTLVYIEPNGEIPILGWLLKKTTKAAL